MKTMTRSKYAKILVFFASLTKRNPLAWRWKCTSSFQILRKKDAKLTSLSNIHLHLNFQREYQAKIPGQFQRTIKTKRTHYSKSPSSEACQWMLLWKIVFFSTCHQQHPIHHSLKMCLRVFSLPPTRHKSFVKLLVWRWKDTSSYQILRREET